MADVMIVWNTMENAMGASGKLTSGLGYNLTDKQYAFVMAYVHGVPNPDTKGIASKSYSEIYNWNGSKNGLYVEASKLLSTLKISKAIFEEMTKVEKKHTLQGDKLRRFILERLLHESTEGNSPSSRVRSLELLGKSEGVNLFTEKIETSQKLDITNSKESLEESIRLALEDEKVIALFSKDTVK